ncbi:MAG: phosphotransferase [Actinomycetota bacterium]
MSDSRLDRWVHEPHLRFDLRSSVAIAASASAGAKRRAVDALQSGGGRGALAQRALAVPFARLPPSMAARLPRVSRTPDAGLAIAPDAARSVLTHAVSVLDESVSDVVWLLPPPSDGARVSALLLDGSAPCAHLRVTDLVPVDRPNPTTTTGRRTGIEWPVMLDVWEHDGVVVELTTAVDLGATSPTDLSLEALEDLIADLQDSLGPPRPGSVAAHGDLTPWNLRTASDGRRALFDWEHRVYGPDGIDLVRFIVAGGDGPARFAELPADRRRHLRPAVEYLVTLADEREATRRHEAVSEWKSADIAAERAALEAILDLAR